MNWIKVDEEIFDYVGKRISEGDTAMYGRVTYEMKEIIGQLQATNRLPASTILNIQNGITKHIKLFYPKQ